nr:response regulator [Desulfosarcina cetonica]
MNSMPTIETTEPLVLVVDDDDDIRDILYYGITHAGCRCLTADSGESALKQLQSEPIEVVISDIQMVGMNGLELCRQIKSRYEADVIIITGLVNNFAYEEIIADGASDFIEKPIRLAEIVARLKRVLHERKIRGQLKATASELSDNVGRFRNAMEGFVQAISLAVEIRDPYTAGHQNRVADLSSAIGQRMGLSDDRIYGLRMAAVIHDLGKITVPGEILCKPGRLSAPEYAMIRTHVQSGYDILKKSIFPGRWPRLSCSTTNAWMAPVTPTACRASKSCWKPGSWPWRMCSKPSVPTAPIVPPWA